MTDKKKRVASLHKFWSATLTDQPFNKFLKACEDSKYVIEAELRGRKIDLISSYSGKYYVLITDKISNRCRLHAPHVSNFRRHSAIILSLFPSLPKDIKRYLELTNCPEIFPSDLEKRGGMF